MVDPNAFKEAMQRMAAPVTAITTLQDGQPAGLMATAVCSLSADPPSLVVCVNKTATAHDAILAAGVLGVSLFSDGGTEQASHFAATKGIERFARGTWVTRATGAPLAADAPVAFDCRIAKCHDGYSHTIIVAEILDIHFSEDKDPACLIWHKRGFTRLERPAAG